MLLSQAPHSEEDPWGFQKILGQQQVLDFSQLASKQQIELLINRYPFLRIFDAHTDLTKITELPSPRLIRAETGWLMHDFGFCIFSSLGELLYGDYSQGEGSENEEGGIEGAREGKSTAKLEIEERRGILLNAGKGTFVKQSFDTAAEMVALGRSHGWEAVYILEGTKLMEWSAWLIAEELDMKAEGYQPTRQDIEKRKRLNRSKIFTQMEVRLRLY